jgi:hypothetical protein
MRYFLATICVTAFIVLSSCCKKGITTSNSIIGTWELRQAQTGMIPTIDYPRGNGNTLIFSGSGYEKYVNGNLVKSGTYTLVRDDSVEATVGLVVTAGQFTNRIIFDNDLVSSKTFIQVSNKNLTLLSGYFPLDGGSHLLYERIKDEH